MTTTQTFLRFTALLLSGLLFSATGFTQESSPSTDGLEKMNPFTVSALYAAVDIQFTLSGQNLFDPLIDPVDTAEISAVVVRDPDDIPDVAVRDKLLRIDGVELKGLTIPQIAELLNNARAKGIPTWEMGQFLNTKTIKFDGDWLTPLPGLKR